MASGWGLGCLMCWCASPRGSAEFSVDVWKLYDSICSNLSTGVWPHHMPHLKECWCWKIHSWTSLVRVAAECFFCRAHLTKIRRKLQCLVARVATMQWKCISFTHIAKIFFFRSPNRYEYHWADGTNIKKPIKCSAPKYIDYLMTWVQDQLDDETLFPSKIGNCNCCMMQHALYIGLNHSATGRSLFLLLNKLKLIPSYWWFSGVPFPKNFMSVAKTILKRLFRVYAHIYHQHFDSVMRLQEEAHLNTSFKHFIFFVQVSCRTIGHVPPPGFLVSWFAFKGSWILRAYLLFEGLQQHRDGTQLSSHPLYHVNHTAVSSGACFDFCARWL